MEAVPPVSMPLSAFGPAGVSTVVIPKPSGGTRTLTILAREQARRYALTVAAVARRTDASLGPEVFSDRLIDDGRREAWRPAFRRFLARTRDLRREARGPVLVLDVASCFESISPHVVESALLEAGCHPSEILPVRRELETLAASGVRGLPIGPAPSATLGAAVLRVIDRAIAQTGLPHARWVDDVVAFPATDGLARRLLERVGDALAPYGMSLHADKSGVFDGHAPLIPSLSSAVRLGVSSARR